MPTLESTVEPEPAQKGVAAKLARYSPEELRTLPPEAVSNSFGCGNPLAFDDLKEGDVVLDLGSGAGIDLLLAAKRVGPTGRAIGVDMTDEMIAQAQVTFGSTVPPPTAGTRPSRFDSRMKMNMVPTSGM